jgi:hypothetical protein
MGAVIFVFAVASAVNVRATKASTKGYQAPPQDPPRCYSRSHQNVNTASCSPHRCGSSIRTWLSRDTSGTQSVPKQRNSRWSDLRRACQPKDNHVYERLVRPQAPRSDPLRLQDIGYDSCKIVQIKISSICSTSPALSGCSLARLAVSLFVLVLVLLAPVLLAVLPVENASTRFTRLVEYLVWFAVFSALAPPASRFLRLCEPCATRPPSCLRLVSFALRPLHSLGCPRRTGCAITCLSGAGAFSVCCLWDNGHIHHFAFPISVQTNFQRKNICPI